MAVVPHSESHRLNPRWQLLDSSIFMSVFCDHVLDDFSAWSKNISVILELSPCSFNFCFGVMLGHLVHFSFDFLSCQWELMHVYFFVRDSEALMSSAVPL